MHCRWYPSMPCSRSWGGGVTQHALQVSRPTPRWEVEGSGQGGSPGPHPGGVSRPTPGGCIPACPEAAPPGRLLLRAVRILLECILVSCVFALVYLCIISAWDIKHKLGYLKSLRIPPPTPNPFLMKD